MANQPKRPQHRPIDNNYGHLQPQAPDIEKIVLGALMIDKDAFTIVGEILHPETFYEPRNQKIYSAIQKLNIDERPVDILTVIEELKHEGTLEEVGGEAYVIELSSHVASSAHIEYHAHILAQKYMARQLISFASVVETKAFDDTVDVDELMQETESSLFELSQKNLRQDYTQVDPVVKEAIKILQKAAENKGELTGVPTGYRKLDEITAGWQASDLVIIAGRPAMGKTAFALNIALHVGSNQGLPVGVFSLEMSAEEVTGRLLSAKGEIPQSELKTGHLENWRGFYDAAESLEKAPIFIDDTAGISILNLRSRARQLMSRVGGKLGLIVVDYLQLMSGESGGRNDANRAQEIAEISRGLKGLARELKVPVIALSQLKREVDTRPNKRPLMSDLRESGSIEQDADVIIFLYREVAYQQKTDDMGEDGQPMPAVDSNAPSDAEAIIAKQRSGPTGTVNLIFQGMYTRFVSRATPAQMHAGY